MPAYEVIGGASNLRVQGDNWLSALGASLEYFGLDSGAVARLVINVGSDGTVDVSDPVSGRRFALKPAEDVRPASLDLNQFADPAVMEVDGDASGDEAPATPGAPPPIFSMPGQSLLDDTPPPPPPAPPAPPAPVAPPEPPPAPKAKGPPPPPPGLVSAPVAQTPPEPPPPPPAPVSPPAPPAPVAPPVVEQPLAQKPSREEHAPTIPPSALEQESDRPEDLAEQLFELTFEIMMANDIGEACYMSLQTLQNLVPGAEAGAVLYSDINSVGLTFMAAFGPAARSLQGKTISFETGVAGFCHQHGVGLVIQDTVTDERHDKSVDQAVGFQTRSILAAAVLSPGGHTYGCIELLNAPDGFRDWHLEAAQSIAGALADFASRREFQ